MRHALVLMAYGTPGSLADVEAYYADVRGGRPPRPDQLAELMARYTAVGGRTPLLDTTLALADAVRGRLAELGGRIAVHVAMRHWDPRPAAVAERLRAEGVERVVGIALAPHYSSMSTGAYERSLRAALPETVKELVFVKRWWDRPGFVRLLAGRVRDALERLHDHGRARVVFSAHSLPEKILAVGDPYRDELLRSSALVAGAAGVTDWRFSFQSAGRTEEAWLGPELLETLDSLARSGPDPVLVVPIGFTCDHLEVLYDIDVEATQHAGRLGLRLSRTRSLNADPALAELLAELALESLA